MKFIPEKMWQKVASVATAIGAVATILWSIASFANSHVESVASSKVAKDAPALIDKKIKQHTDQTELVIGGGIKMVQRQMFTIEQRMIKNELKDLTKDKTVDELSASDKSEYDELMEEQKAIKKLKRELDQF